MDQLYLRSRSVASKRVALGAVVVLHALAILLWPSRPPIKAGVQAELDIVFIAPPRQAGRPAAAAPRPAAKASPRAVAPVAPAAPAMTLIETPAARAEVSAAAPEEAAPAPSAADILDRARRDIGGIDRAVRKQSLDMAVRNFKPTETKFERAVASAYGGGGDGMRIVDMVMPDGSRISKVIMGKKSYCVTTGSNGLVGARDVFKSGVQTKVTNCPT